MKMSRNAVRNLCFLVGLVALLLMVMAGDPRVLWHNVVSMGWCLPLIVAVWGIGYVLNAYSWGTIIRQNPLAKSLPFGTLYRYTVAGFAINYITPFGLLGGEPYRVMELKPYIGLERATGTVVLYMMMHVCSHFLFWIMSCGLAVAVVPELSVTATSVLCTITVTCLVLIGLFFKGYRAGMIVGLMQSLSHWPIIGQKILRWTGNNRERLTFTDKCISSLLLQHPLAFWTSLGVEFASRMVNCFEIYIIAQILGAPLGYADAVLVVAFSSLFANVLFFSPLQLGTREGGIFLALQFILPGWASAELMPLAVSISLMTRVREFAWIALGLLFMKMKNGKA